MVAQGHRTVVVADDDPALRMLCRINLELEGYRVLEAQSARELEQHLDSEDVDVVLLDVRLGTDDGREVARELRGERPELPIAFFTGSAPVDDHVGTIADGVLPKPFSLEELSEIVRRLAAR